MFLDWPLGLFHQTPVQCISNAALNVALHIAHLLAAYYSNSIVTSRVNLQSDQSVASVRLFAKTYQILDLIGLYID